MKTGPNNVSGVIWAIGEPFFFVSFDSNYDSIIYML